MKAYFVPRIEVIIASVQDCIAFSVLSVEESGHGIDISYSDGFVAE